MTINYVTLQFFWPKKYEKYGNMNNIKDEYYFDNSGTRHKLILYWG